MSKYIIHFDTGRTWRGGQNQVFLLIKGLKENGYKQKLISPKRSKLYKKVKELGVDVHGVCPLNDLDLIAGLKVRNIIKKENPDVLHLHSAKSLGIAALALRGLDIKTVHTRRVDLPIKSTLSKKGKYTYPDSIVVISDFIEQYFRSIGFNNISKIYSAVDLYKFPYLPKKLGLPSAVGMIGALDLKHKDFITFLNAAKIYIDSNIDDKRTKFVIIGDGKDHLAVKEYINEIGISDRVELPGFTDNINKIFERLDILVHNVHFEGLGTVILQAMSSGIPVVATDIGGIPEIINNDQNGYLVGHNDHTATAEKIKKLVDDIDVRMAFAQEGRKTVEEKFSSRVMVDKYSKLYGEL